MSAGWDAREALEDERVRTRRRLADLTGDYAGIVEAARDSNVDDEHDPEGATIAYERAQLTALLAQAREDLVVLDRALGVLHAGDDVRCAVCDEPIALERLLALPTARTCIACAPR